MRVGVRVGGRVRTRVRLALRGWPGPREAGVRLMGRVKGSGLGVGLGLRLTLRGSGRGKKRLPECESCSRLHRSGSVALGRRPISSRRGSRPGVFPRSFCEG